MSSTRYLLETIAVRQNVLRSYSSCVLVVYTSCVRYGGSRSVPGFAYALSPRPRVSHGCSKPCLLKRIVIGLKVVTVYWQSIRTRRVACVSAFACTHSPWPGISPEVGIDNILRRRRAGEKGRAQGQGGVATESTVGWRAVVFCEQNRRRADGAPEQMNNPTLLVGNRILIYL